MHKSMAGLALGVLLSLPAAPAAYAAQSIDTAAFTITYREGLFSNTGSITLVEESPGAYRFSLDTLNDDMARVEAQDQGGAGAFASGAHASILRIEANAGYRVTGVGLVFTAFGELTPGQVTGFPPGFVSNDAALFMGVWTASEYRSFGTQFSDFQAEQTGEFDGAGLDLPRVTDLAFNAWLEAQAFGVDGGGELAPSLASAGLRDVVLRVDVAPIPEPATYAMLLGGLGMLGAARMRSRRA